MSRTTSPQQSAAVRLRACGRNRMPALFLALLALAGLAGSAGATKYAGEFLRIGVGARALGMGGSFVAIADDASAAYWNPAGLAGLGRAELLFMHAEQFGNLENHDYVSFVQPLSGAGKPTAIGISLIRLSVGDILVTKDAYDDTNRNGQWDPGETIRPDLFHTENDTEYGLLLSYARETSSRLSLGGNIKILRQSLVGHSSFGVGCDLGALFHPLSELTLGVRLADVTTTAISWDTGRKESILPTLHLGAAWTREIKPVRGTVTAGLGLSSSFDREKEASQFSGGAWGGELHAGLEYWYARSVAVRVGTDSGHFTAGAGLRFRGLGVDYAYLSHEDLDATHRVSASVRF
jgi:hypothetical protein